MICRPYADRDEATGAQLLEQRVHRRRDAVDEPALDRDAEQHPGHRLRAGPRVAKRFCVALAVLLVNELAAARDEQARDLSELVEVQVGEDATADSFLG